jgi:hypothetical protein
MSREIQQASNFLTHNLEAVIWLIVIAVFALLPLPSGEHFTICPLSLAGFEHCPGCGLGRSLILLLHGKLAESFQMHPLGIFAILVLGLRIGTILKGYFKYQKQVTAND